MRNVLRSSLEGHSITTTSEHAPALEWIEEYHSPFFTHHWQENRLTPHLEIAAAHPEDLALHRNASVVKGFLKRPLYYWQDSIGSHWLDPGRSCISRGHNFLIRINPGSQGPLFEPARLLREIIIQELLYAGAIKLKGNLVVTRNGRGILMLGDKGAGKTIVTLNELLTGGSFIGNSRILVMCKAATVEGIGVPISIRIGEDTIKAIDGLARWYSGYPQNSRLKTDGYDEQVKIRKIEMTPKELAAALCVRIVPSVILDEVWYLTCETADPLNHFKRKVIQKSLINVDPAFPAFWREVEPAMLVDSGGAQEKLLELPWTVMNTDEVLKSFRGKYN